MTQEEIMFYNGIDPANYFIICEIQVLSIIFLLALSAVIWFVLNRRTHNFQGDNQP